MRIIQKSLDSLYLYEQNLKFILLFRRTDEGKKKSKSKSKKVLRFFDDEAEEDEDEEEEEYDRYQAEEVLGLFMIK